MVTFNVDCNLAISLTKHEVALATILEEMRLESLEIELIIQDVRFRKMQTRFQHLLGRTLRPHEQNHLRLRLRAGAMSDDRWLDELCEGK